MTISLFLKAYKKLGSCYYGTVTKREKTSDEERILNTVFQKDME